MRIIETHHFYDKLPSPVRIEVMDDPSHGGANHRYQLYIFRDGEYHKHSRVEFQTGHVNGPNGVNGITNEALLAIVLDRLEGFQKGPVPCRENILAISHIQNGLKSLLRRSEDRIKRGVEGTSNK